MAQFAVLIYAADSAHAPDATAQDTAECDDHADELAEGDAMVGAWALTPRNQAKAVRAHSVTDGPFLETKEVVAGFYLLEAGDIDAAVAIARRNPAAAAAVHGTDLHTTTGGGLVERG